ncbi:hypothetical protein [Crenalkalicoccus roseus]|uniref:hypothetical protein n=1 Tax=Crenalkalicoccus roseus TaxID=1485588 RepID=UPI0010801460|nr:hypothetical protein [Crenalkalicoccus roseus]
MSDTSRAASNKDRLDRTSDQEVEEAVKDTFPASDPTSATASSGAARAVPPETLLREAPPRPADDAVTLSQRFSSAEAAKLALETLVREGPLDRDCAEIRHQGEAATLEVKAPRAEAARLEALLRRQGGAG